MELDIPMLLSVYNELRYESGITAAMPVTVLPEAKKPTACIGCGACAKICPQGIDIPGHMKGMSAVLSTIPDWAEICRQRELAAK